MWAKRFVYDIKVHSSFWGESLSLIYSLLDCLKIQIFEIFLNYTADYFSNEQARVATTASTMSYMVTFLLSNLN